MNICTHILTFFQLLYPLIPDVFALCKDVQRPLIINDLRREWKSQYRWAVYDKDIPFLFLRGTVHLFQLSPMTLQSFAVLKTFLELHSKVEADLLKNGEQLKVAPHCLSGIIILCTPLYLKLIWKEEDIPTLFKANLKAKSVCRTPSSTHVKSVWDKGPSRDLDYAG